jgi:hypothetical protein
LLLRRIVSSFSMTRRDAVVGYTSGHADAFPTCQKFIG